MRDLNDLALFAAVVAHGGFSAAARAVNQPKSRLSRRVAALEAHLGARLLERTTRRFKVTALGEDVYRHARAVLAEADAIDELVLRLKAEPQGLVRVSCPIEIDRLIGLRLPAFLNSHPKLRVQLVVSNRRVDLIDEGIDIAVRVRERLDSDADLQVRVVSRTGLVLVASPRFLAKVGQPDHPSDLPRFPMLLQGDRPGLQRLTLTNADQKDVDVVLEPRLSATAFPVLLQAACDGAGIAALPEFVARPGLASGALVPVLPGWGTPEGIMHLVFASRRGILPGVRATIDFLVEVLGARSGVWEETAQRGAMAAIGAGEA